MASEIMWVTTMTGGIKRSSLRKSRERIPCFAAGVEPPSGGGIATEQNLSFARLAPGYLYNSGSAPLSARV
jgi:hypothetical protein